MITIQEIPLHTDPLFGVRLGVWFAPDVFRQKRLNYIVGDGSQVTPTTDESIGGKRGGWELSSRPFSLADTHKAGWLMWLDRAERARASIGEHYGMSILVDNSVFPHSSSRHEFTELCADRAHMFGVERGRHGYPMMRQSRNGLVSIIGVKPTVDFQEVWGYVYSVMEQVEYLLSYSGEYHGKK